jgi:hypothetical protein
VIAKGRKIAALFWHLRHFGTVLSSLGIHVNKPLIAMIVPTCPVPPGITTFVAP